MTFVFVALATLTAQVTTGSLEGRISANGQPVAGATIQAVSGNIDRQTKTDDAGGYRINALPPGAYQITIQADRFAAQQARTNITVQTQRRLDFNLTPAPLAQSIEVNARLEPTASGLIVDRQQVADLPLNRRDFLQLALLAPGVAPPVEGSQLAQRQSFAMHVNGAREEANGFLLDGADNNDPNTNRYALQPPVDAIEEFQIATNAYSAEYSRNAGGQVNVITRRGGDAWHAFAYEYFRHRHLDARNFFAASQPQFIRNQFGAGVGGPLRKSSTYAFVNWDGLRERRGIPRVATAPSALMRTGNLSELPGTPVDPFTRAPFANKTIPASRIHPLASRVLQLFPLPGANGLLATQPSLRGDQNQWNARLDQRIGNRHLLTTRYSQGAQDLFEPFAQDTASVPGFGSNIDDIGRNAMAQYQHVFTPRFTATFLAAYNRIGRAVIQENAATDVNRLWGVNWLPTRASDFGYPAINIAGFSSIGDTTQIPIDRTGDTVQLNAGGGLTLARHNLKFGVEWRRNRHDGINNLLTRGSLTFSGALSTVGLADALLGFPSLGIQAQADNTQQLRMRSTNLFVQDEWRLNAKLTLSLGARYEYNTPPFDPRGALSILNVATGRLQSARTGVNPDRNNLAPRLGLAWRIDDRTVVRAAYGLFFDAGLLLANTALYFNPPAFTIRVHFPTATSLLTLNDPFPRTGGITPPASLSTLAQDATTAYMNHWNLSAQRTIAGGTATVAYAASQGRHWLRSRDLNQPAPAPGDLAARRPYPAFANIFYTESASSSNYHSLQASYQRPLARRWSMIAAYTFAKSIDDASAFLGTRGDKNFPQDSRNLRAERGLSNFDQRHRATVATVVRLPWALETSLLASAATGQPFTPLLRFDNSNTGNTGGQFGNDRPDLLRNPALAQRTPDRWFDPNAFAVPARYRFGSAGRNIVTGPGFSSLDASLARTFALRERLALRLEAQVFNLANRTNFDLPERFADEPATFARIFSAKPPRQVQFSLRLSF